MSNRLLKVFLLFLCAIESLDGAMAFLGDHATVLVLNSYHSGYEWSDLETKGINDALAEMDRVPLVYIEYMDSKRSPEELHQEQIKEMIRRRYSRQRLDLIIAEDNWAMDFAFKYRNELFPEVPILFCGINGLQVKEIQEPNAAGLLEKHDLLGTAEMALNLHPERKKLYILRDNSEASLLENAQLSSQIKAKFPDIEIEEIQDFYWEELPGILRGLPEDSLLLLSTSLVDKAQRILTCAEIGRMIAQNTSIPVYTGMDIYLVEGVIGGHQMMAHNHGVQTGLLAKEFLEGKKEFEEIGIRYDERLQWVFQYDALVHWSISEDSLPLRSLILGKPASYAKWLWWIVPVSAFLMVETLLILFLLVARRRWKSAMWEIKEREKHLRLIFEHSPMAVALVNGKMEFEYVNHFFTDTFGTTLTELSSDKKQENLNKCISEEVKKHLQETALERMASKEVSVKGKGSRLLQIELIHTKIGEKYVVVMHDITARKEIEEAMKRARDAATAASEAKSQFLANMSHEIRTPMNAVLGMAQLMTKTELTEEQDYFLQTILSSGELLLTIISDLLDISKIEAGRLEIDSEPFVLNECIESSCKLMTPRFKEKKLSFIREISDRCPKVVRGDFSRLQQVLINLLNNACKYTEKGGVCLNIDAEMLDEHYYELTFKVKDTGIGIRSKVLPMIFDAFNQGDASSTRKYGGTGLGLTIVKHMVETMGGMVQVQSQEGIGSEFTVSIPMRIDHLANDQDKTKTLREISGSNLKAKEDLSILVTEDNMVNMKLVHMILKKMGYHADSAYNGKEAIDLVAQKHYDVVFMDIQMPVMDGIAATQHIRCKIPQEEQPYIIALTAHAMKSDADKCLQSGMDDYLTKPIKLESLEKCLNKALHNECFDEGATTRKQRDK
ncbi:MAG: response regulator [Opitutales bacterium]|nr:response regulator [Opitutales bacterium]